MKERYIAEDILTGTIYGVEIPLETEGPSMVLNGPGALRGTIIGSVENLRDESGELILREWGTFLHLEQDGVIRWTGILILSKGNKIEAAGFSVYATDQPYDAEHYGINEDPVALIRRVWDYLQAQPQGNIGVKVVGSTPVRLGTDSDVKVGTAQGAADAARAAVDSARKQKRDSASNLAAQVKATTASITAMTKQLTTAKANLTTYRRDYAPNAPEIAQQVSLVAQLENDLKTLTNYKKSLQSSKKTSTAQWDAFVKAREAEDKAAQAALKKAQDKARDDGGAFKMLWWDGAECNRLIDEICAAAGLDFVEWSGWNADRTKILKEIRVGWPRVGRRRSDIRFEQGVNVAVEFEPVLDGDLYANSVVGLGAGEGRKALRRQVSYTEPGRVRRARFVDRKGVKRADVMLAELQSEIVTSRMLPEVEDITVVGSALAPYRSWTLGDDVLLTWTTERSGTQRVWHRIIEIQGNGEGQDELRLQRSDRFVYRG